MVIFDNTEVLTQEEIRLKQDKARTHYWKRWGPYVSERQWGTGIFNVNCLVGAHSDVTVVREDYSCVRYYLKYAICQC